MLDTFTAKFFKLKTPTVNHKKWVISKTVLVSEVPPVSKTDLRSFFLPIFRTQQCQTF